MTDSINTQKVKKICQEFFDKIGFLQELSVEKIQEKTLPVKIRVDEPRILIGQNGQTLREIQHLLKSILRRKFGPDFYLDLDINDYKKKKAEYLRDLAQSTADQVALTKKQRELQPMPAYERRIIHLDLAERQDIITESTGEEPERRIVIKPYS